MKKYTFLNAVILILILLPIKNAHADLTNATVTASANPSLGGTITGTGTYPTGTVVNVQIQANSGWYLSNVTYDGPPGPTVNGQIRLNPAESWQKMLQLDYALGQNNPGGFDPTTITNFAPQIYLLTNCIVTAWFTGLSPTVNSAPIDQTIIAGGSVTLTENVTGRLPLTYQWQKDSTNISGATSSSLALGVCLWGVGSAGRRCPVPLHALGESGFQPGLSPADCRQRSQCRACGHPRSGGLSPARRGCRLARPDSSAALAALQSRAQSDRGAVGSSAGCHLQSPP
jgi:hypothetical protein